MAIISDLVPNKAGDRTKLYLDGELYGWVSSDTVIRYGLKKGFEIDVADLDVIADESGKELASAYLLSYLTKYAATEKKARETLKRKGYSATASEYAIAKAKEYNYIDDRAFAERYIERKLAHSGVIKIKSELIMLGVKSSVISELIGELDEDEIFDGAMKVAERWWSSRDLSDRGDRDKFVRYMGSKGFKWDITGKCMTELRKRECEEKSDGGE